ncbi:MAG: SGNH/GDSL hydrolase family protein [Bradymonadia bacterium]
MRWISSLSLCIALSTLSVAVHADELSWPAAPVAEANGPPPAQTRYGAFPELWFQTNIDRYAATRPKTIMSLGDSLSNSQAFIWLARYTPTGISDQEGYTHINKDLGTMSGQLSSWGRQRAVTACNQGKPELITVLFGTNDYIHRRFNAGEFYQNLESMVSTCMAHGSLPMLMTLPPWQWRVNATAQANRIVRQVARQKKLPLFDFAQILVDRGNLRADMPDGVHPNRTAYEAINTEWIKFYKYIEHHVLRPGRAKVLPKIEVEQALPWKLAFEWSGGKGKLPQGFEAREGEWSLKKGKLVGKAGADRPAWLTLPVSAPGRVRVEITAQSNGAEIALVVHSGGDPAATGIYYGFGTNGGARTAINIDDVRVAQVPKLKPTAGQSYTLRGVRGQRYARFGLDGRHQIDHIVPPLTPRADRAMVGLYTWGGQIEVSQIKVWVDPAAP